MIQINVLYKLGFKTIKVASSDCASYQLLRELVKKFNNIIVSTGMTYDDEIQKAYLILKMFVNKLIFNLKGTFKHKFFYKIIIVVLKSETHVVGCGPSKNRTWSF